MIQLIILLMIEILICIAACNVAGKADEREEELFKEYMEKKESLEDLETIKDKLLDGEIGIDEYIDLYNELVDREADRMQKASPTGPHEHI